MGSKQQKCKCLSCQGRAVTYSLPVRGCDLPSRQPLPYVWPLGAVIDEQYWLGSWNTYQPEVWEI